jgi:dGTPase
LSDLGGVPIAGAAAADVEALAGSKKDSRIIYEVTRRMITIMIRDLVEETRGRLRALAPGDPNAIRSAGAPLAAFSDPMQKDMQALKAFLFERVYRSPRVSRVMRGAESVVRDLFETYWRDVGAMPQAWAAAVNGLDERRRARLIADFVAGMTDRYALDEHRRLFDATPELR